MIRFQPRLRSVLACAIGAAALAATLLAVPTAAAAATDGPDPVFYADGGNPSGSCEINTQPMSTSVTSLATALGVAVRPLPYEVCDFFPETLQDKGTSARVLQEAALDIARGLRSTTSASATSTVDVVTNSLGGLVTRACIVLANTPGQSPDYEPCLHIDDLISLVPPSHGSADIWQPPANANTCSRPSTIRCVPLASGLHVNEIKYLFGIPVNYGLFRTVQSQNLCQYMIGQTRMCNVLKQGSGDIRSLTQAPYGALADETPGTTDYTTFFSDRDEMIHYYQDNRPTGTPAHSSMLIGGLNYKVRDQTHASMLSTTGSSTRLHWKAESSSAFGLSRENVTVPPCGAQVIAEIKRLLPADAGQHAPPNQTATTPATPLPGCA